MSVVLESTWASVFFFALCLQLRRMKNRPANIALRYY